MSLSGLSGLSGLSAIFTAAAAEASDNSPDEFANLWGWWQADAGITKDGSDLVSNWADQSGNGRDLVQATGANQPTWIDAQQNGLPSIDFDGTASFMQVSSGVPATGANTRCIIAVIINPTISASDIYQHVCHYGQANAGLAYGATIRSYTPQTTNPGPGNHYWGSGFGNVDAYSSGLDSVLTLWYDGTDDHMRLNGTEYASKTVALNTDSSVPFIVGRRITAGEYYDGGIGELVVYSTAPSVTDIALIEAALMTRWGLS